MTPPTSQQEIRLFTGIVNYYHNMWARQSHTLATLIKITPNKVKFK